MHSDEITVVKSFIEAINAYDLKTLENLMTKDHTFIDATGRRTSGRDEMILAWQKYFDMFPDYAVNIDSILQDGPLVAIFGSTSGTYKGKEGLKPENEVGGPAAWKALVENGKVKLWQVYADYTETWKVIEANQTA
ncbi:nuclear transport factor 2 family protein [candidate division KSB1 bacterium]|nr:nuclear transport factor 2 family protein [candidate division KSB1 bacterium]NIR72079.1 nuclear transport factor 2 family protein [candidate division KSB1 bacterium]NIS25019.1 nuclear transport factor 2 family protein [candidate division KSB1 bacterium]NIT71929.1 nuclear transport factor 2 family protein [candidate division KSB1 bacterium]NIU25672.1 nuclear transport factor 2 family protein [candidate division KSB1 bacterium]